MKKIPKNLYFSLLQSDNTKYNFLLSLWCHLLLLDYNLIYAFVSGQIHPRLFLCVHLNKSNKSHKLTTATSYANFNGIIIQYQRWK